MITANVICVNRGEADICHFADSYCIEVMYMAVLAIAPKMVIYL